MSLDNKRVGKKKKNVVLTDTAKFLGFIFHIPANDEFTAKIEGNCFIKIIGYPPDYVIKYKRYGKAIKASTKFNKYKTIYGYLFDLDEEYYVGFSKECK